MFRNPKCAGDCRHRFPGNALIYLGILLLAALLVPRTALAEMLQPPGSRVEMDVPKNFEISKLFSGFVFPNAGASFVIAELPTARLDAVKAGFTDEALAKKGITKIKRSQLARKDQHIYLTGEQPFRGDVLDKHVLLIEDEKALAVITANIPVSSYTDGFLDRKAVVAALTSASLKAKAAPIIKQFSLSHLGPFKEAGKLMGSAILYSPDGQLTPKTRSETRTVLIIAPSIDRVAVPDLNAFGGRAVRSLSGFTAFKAGQPKAVKIAGLDGVRHDATATATSDKRDVVVHHLVLARKGGGYYRLVAIVRKEDAATISPAVEKIFAGFKPVD